MNFWQPGKTLADVEKEVILECFKFYQKNKKMTAQALGIAPRTLDYKLEEYERKEKAVEREPKENGPGPELRNVAATDALQRIAESKAPSVDATRGSQVDQKPPQKQSVSMRKR